MFDRLFASLLISRSAVVPAPPQQVFDLLADPKMHSVIDGSGTVQGAGAGAPARLSMGAKFGMSMKQGVPYKMNNTVSEFDEPRRIAWHHIGGHVWRYELEPADGGTSTKVTETFDGRSAKFPPALLIAGYQRRHPKSIEQTLQRLVAHFTTA